MCMSMRPTNETRARRFQRLTLEFCFHQPVPIGAFTEEFPTMSTTYKSTDIDRILARIDDLEHLFDEYCVLERLAELEAKMQSARS